MTSNAIRRAAIVLLAAATLALMPLGASAHGYVIWLDEHTFFAVDPDHAGGQLCGAARSGAILFVTIPHHVTPPTYVMDPAGGCTYPRFPLPMTSAQICKYLIDLATLEFHGLACTGEISIE